MGRSLSSAMVILAVLLLGLLALGSDAALYDRKRGFQTYKAPDADIAAYLKSHDAATILERHRNVDKLKEHPDVQKFLDWSQKRRDGHPEGAGAFAGKIPHDFIPHLSHKEEL